MYEAAWRLAVWLEKYRDEFFPSMSHPEVAAATDHGKRKVRFAVSIRALLYGIRGD